MAELYRRRIIPGDMTVYRTVYGRITIEEDNELRHDLEHVFFAFGLGDRSMIATTFRRAEVSLPYFEEKFAGLINRIAIVMGWLTLLHVMGYPLPETLSDGRYDHWYSKLDPDWVNGLPVLQREKSQW